MHGVSSMISENVTLMGLSSGRARMSMPRGEEPARFMKAYYNVFMSDDAIPVSLNIQNKTVIEQKPNLEVFNIIHEHKSVHVGGGSGSGSAPSGGGGILPVIVLGIALLAMIQSMT